MPEVDPDMWNDVVNEFFDGLFSAASYHARSFWSARLQEKGVPRLPAGRNGQDFADLIGDISADDLWLELIRVGERDVETQVYDTIAEDTRHERLRRLRPDDIEKNELWRPLANALANASAHVRRHALDALFILDIRPAVIPDEHMREFVPPLWNAIFETSEDRVGDILDLLASWLQPVPGLPHLWPESDPVCFSGTEVQVLCAQETLAGHKELRDCFMGGGTDDFRSEWLRIYSLGCIGRDDDAQQYLEAVRDDRTTHRHVRHLAEGILARWGNNA